LVWFGLSLVLCLLTATSVPAQPPQGGGNFITYQGKKFMLNDQEYKAIGMCNYPFTDSNYDYTERELRRAKAAGVTLIRGGLEFFTYSGVAWNTESYWKKMDWLLKVARDNDMHVAIDCSGFMSTLMNYYSVDFVAAANYHYWDDMVDFMTSRVNTFTGVAYKDDPTIFQYLILGETVPYGYNGDITTTSRDVNAIENMLLHVAARLRAKDPHHLISAGGLLHMSVPLDSYNRDYWKTLWSNANIDCGAIHIYLSDYTVFPSGSWSNLATYKTYTDSINKPFVLEEFGLDLYQNSITVAQNYFNNVYNLTWSLGIPIVITWSWGPSGGYSIFPRHTDSLVSIVSTNAQRWGYTGAISTYTDPPFQASQTLYNFESTAESFASTGYGGNNGAPVRSTTRASNGSASLRVPVNFASTGWNFAGVYKGIAGLPDWSSQIKLAADVYVPSNATALQIKFILYNQESGWVSYAQNGGISNNWLDPGHWNTVYANLTPQSIDWSATPPSGFNKMVQLSMEIHHAYGSPVFTGDVFIDNVRLGDFLATPVELSEFAVE
jgi:mannan endo-1,4-beta-mannosidase